MIDLETAHLTLHHLQTLIRRGPSPALRYELQNKEERDRFVAALQTALDLLDWEGVVLTCWAGEASVSELIKGRGLT